MFWQGHPWVVPRLIAGTTVLVVIGLVLTLAEVRLGVAMLRATSIPVLGWTYGVMGIVWLLSALGLAILRASHKYVLRQSSLEVGQGILSRKIYTLSAAGFSDLEVIQGIGGRMLNMGDIQLETDSSRDLRMVMIRDPMGVASRIRQVMATPMVRIAPEVAPPSAGEQKA